MARIRLAALLAAIGCTAAYAEVTHWYQFGVNTGDLSIAISSDDLINGFGVNTNGSPINEGINESANSPYTLGFIDVINNVNSWLMNSGTCLPMIEGLPSDGFLPGLPPSCPAGGMANLVDGQLGTACMSVLRDYARASLVVRYGFAEPTDIGRIRVFAANLNNRDGRVFQHYDVYARQGDCADGTCPAHGDDAAVGFDEFFLVASSVKSGPFGLTNTNIWQGTATEVYDTDNPILIQDCTDLRIVFYTVDNTAGRFQDPWQGYDNEEPEYREACSNGFPQEEQDTDGFRKSFVASIIKEIDVLPPGPSPLANADYDADIDLFDLAVYQRCFGSNYSVTSICSRYDVDADNDVDLDDYAVIGPKLTGPQAQ